MVNDLPEKQNSERFIDLLAASSHVYVVCKRIATAQTSLALFAAALGPVLGLYDPTLRVWGAIVGIMVLVVDTVILNPWHDRCRQLGTKIQELFDTELLQLPWNKLKCGELPDQEALGEHARAYRRSHPLLNQLHDWYPDVRDVPLPYARLICQRSNLRWDMSLRNKYAFFLLVMLVCLLLGGLVYAVSMKLTAEQLVLSVLVPVLPLVSRLEMECREQYRVARDLEQQKSYIEGIWQKSLSDRKPTGEELLAESRRLQDVIYDRRLRSPRVPSVLHNLMRDEYQKQMEDAARDYAEKIKKSLTNLPFAVKRRGQA